MEKKQRFYKIPRLLTVESLNTCFIRYYDGEYSFEGEMHDFWELIYVFEGSATIAKDNEIYILNQGDIAFHKPMEFHRVWGNGNQFSIMVITFTAYGNALDILAKNIYNIDLKQHNALFDIKNEIDETYEVRRIALYSDGTSPISLNTIALKLELFMLDLCKIGISEKKAEQSNTTQEFSKIINVMYSNLAKNLSIEELASLCKLGTSNLKKICHKYAGVGPAKHFLRLKIARAIELLESGLTATEVSDSLGFSSQSYFSTVFKRETGVSPCEVKKDNVFKKGTIKHL